MLLENRAAESTDTALTSTERPLANAPKPGADPVMNAPLFDALDPEAAAAVRASMVEVNLSRGQVLFREGDHGDRLYIVAEGKLKVGRCSRDGREQMLSLVGPGEMFGELTVFDPTARMGTASAVTDCRLFSFSSENLHSWLAERPDVAVALLRQLSRRLRRSSEVLSDLVFSDVPGRVAKCLMDLSGRFGTPTAEGVYVGHDLTQEELAQLVGASRETVNKSLADFAARGWLRREGRAVLLIDLERLARRAR